MVSTVTSLQEGPCFHPWLCGFRLLRQSVQVKRLSGILAPVPRDPDMDERLWKMDGCASAPNIRFLSYNQVL